MIVAILLGRGTPGTEYGSRVKAGIQIMKQGTEHTTGGTEFLVWVVHLDLLSEICIYAIEDRSCLRLLSHIFDINEANMNKPIKVHIVY